MQIGISFFLDNSGLEIEPGTLVVVFFHTFERPGPWKEVNGRTSYSLLDTNVLGAACVVAVAF